MRKPPANTTKPTMPLCVTILEEFVVNELSHKKIEVKYNLGGGAAARSIQKARAALWKLYRDSVQFPGPEGGYHPNYTIPVGPQHYISGRHREEGEPDFFSGDRLRDDYQLVPRWPYETDEMRKNKDIFSHLIHLYRVDLKKGN
jgi:hypothetical protein